MSPVPDRTKPERSASASQPADPESPTIDPTTDIEDPSEGNDADLPITMAASVVLTSLPRDAHEALEGAGDLGVEKGMHFFLYIITLFPPKYHSLTHTTSSNDSTTARPLSATAQPTHLQDLSIQALRDGSQERAAEAEAQGDGECVLLCQQRVCARAG